MDTNKLDGGVELQIVAFDPAPACPKCKHEYVSMRYCTNKHNRSSGTKREMELVAMVRGSHPPEHIDVSCDRCDYTWMMNVARTEAPTTRLNQA